MKASKVFMGTIQFVLLKAALGFAEITIAILALLALVTGGYNIGGTTGVYISMFVWIVLSSGGAKLISRMIGYMIKAGHVAVVAETCSAGKVPDSPVRFGFQKVKSRFGASAAFFLVDQLVSGAVKQIQGTVGKVGSLLSFVPGMEKITSITQKFIGIFLNYIDECCLGWCFLHEEEGTFKAACDGVVIYFQNVKHMLKSAAVTVVTVIIATAAAGGLSVLFINVIGFVGSLQTLILLLAAAMLAVVLKTSLIDSWMMVKMMCSYMQVAPGTTITWDLYEKLCGLSTSFKKLFKKAQKEAAGATT